MRERHTLQGRNACEKGQKDKVRRAKKGDLTPSFSNSIPPLVTVLLKFSITTNIQPEFLMGGAQIFIDGIQVGIVSQEHLIGGSMLQHLGNRAQVSTLLCGQLSACRYLDDVKRIGRHNGWVHVAVVQEVPHNLRSQNQMTQSNDNNQRLWQYSVLWGWKPVP